ncbi:MAG: flagellar biosynthesis protein FlgN [Rhodobacteraceae bacterium]|nr:flagellar biosynthesis protein FlgN [Paracoccaceae bacterium]
MTQDDPIMDLLLRERAALKGADFAALGTLAAEKERLLAALRARPTADPAALTRLREMAERNEQLLAALRRGLDSAAQTLARGRRSPEALDTYDQAGQRARIGALTGALTRRA